MLSTTHSVAFSIDSPRYPHRPPGRWFVFNPPPAPAEPLIHSTSCFSGTGAHSSRSEGQLRVTSPAKTTADAGSGVADSSSSFDSISAADEAESAANALTSISAQQASFPQPFAASPIRVAFPPVFRGFDYRLPMAVNFPKLPSHAVNLQQVQLPAQTDKEGEGKEEMEDIKKEEHAVAEVGDHLSHNNHRVKRGGYNAPYFVGKRSLEESEELDQEELQKRDVGSDDVDDDIPELQREAEDEMETRASPLFDEKRRVPMFVGKRKMAPLFVGKRRAPYFVGKRRVPMFVGKRNPPMFVGRAVPMFVGRAAPMFVGKRQAPMFVGKRAVPMFVGKRPSPMFVGKRPSPMFVGKRPSPMFVGKRPSPMFVGKRPSPMFVGKRPSPMFVGKRPSPMFVGKRPSPMFVGKRPSPMFVGKRPSPMFVGKRPSPMFVGKRPSPMFVGKREDDSLNELLAALHTLQAARHYRRMIQADKRHNAPFFVGRRSSPMADDSMEKIPEDKDDYFR